MAIPTILQKILDDRRANGDPDPPPVLLCCASDEEGNEVCITVNTAGECPGSAKLVECTHGQSNSDGTATCHDNDPD